MLVASGCGRSRFAALPDSSVGDDDVQALDAIEPDPIGGRVLVIPMDDVATANGMVASSDPTLSILCETHCPSSVVGKRGNGYHFGDGRYFSIQRPELVTTAPYTVGMWVRTETKPDDTQDCVSKPYAPATTGNVASAWIGVGGPVTFETTANGSPNGDNLSVSVNASDNEWHYVAATWDGAVKRIYSDLSEAYTDDAIVVSVVDSSEPIEIGRDLDVGAPVHYLLGDLDELVFYDRALTATEIAMLPALYSD